MSNVEKATAKAYPTIEQYERWKGRAEYLNMTVSEFIQSMVEAGMRVDRRFEVIAQTDDEKRELLEQRRELQRERDEYRKKLDEARERLADSERETVHNFIAGNSPDGVGFGQIVDHVRVTAPQRVTQHLDALGGETVVENTNTDTYFVPVDQ